MSNNIDESFKPPANSKNDRLKEIDLLYQSQIKQIYNESRESLKEREKEKELESRVKRVQSPPLAATTIKKAASSSNLHFKEEQDNRSTYVARSPQTESRINRLSVQQDKKYEDEKVRASTFLQGESTRTIEILRKENQSKQMKIRELANKCQSLIERLRNHLSEEQMKKELENLSEFSDRKMQRLESLFKIKNEQIFYKTKLQIIKLLQDFQIPKEEINGIDQVNNENTLFSFMVRKLKMKLKDFRSKEQESNFQIQKDKILNQKYEERVQFLMETNQLLKLSESKLKIKIQDLRAQLGQYLQKIKSKEEEIEDKEGEIFRLKKENEELQANNQKLLNNQRNLSSERGDDRRVYEAKEKEMKALLASYFLERKKLESELEEKEGEIEEIIVKEKYLQLENERLNREYVRLKERYEWLEKEKENRQRDYEEERSQLLADFEEYKRQNNQGVYMGCKTETDEALRKVEEYQNAYQKILRELEDEKRLNQMRMEEAQREYEELERERLEQIGRIERMKEQEMYELAADHENRQRQLREEFQKRHELLGEEMQARMKAKMAENDKHSTDKLIQLSDQNDDLKRELESLTRLLEIKETVINSMHRKPQD